MLNMGDKDTKTVRIDIFDIPKEEAQTFMQNRERCASEVEKVMAPYVKTIVRDTLDPEEGQLVIGYMNPGEIAFTVGLDPFEIPVMLIAIERGKLVEYVLAANGLDESALPLMKEAALK